MSGKFSVKIIDLHAEDRVIVLSKTDATKAYLKAFDRVDVKAKGRSATAVLYLSDKLAEEGMARVTRDLAKALRVRDGSGITVSLAPRPRSVTFLKKKMDGGSLTKDEMKAIVSDIVSGHLGTLETLAFAMAEKYVGMSMDETQYLTEALVETGETLKFDRPTYDKHSTGGVPGNKVSLLIVPIVAAAGLLIPKTSSRAITSASGTADTMEVLADVEFTASELMEIAKKVGGAIVWGGMLNVAPGDDAIIKVEYPVGLDPESQMMSSILAKKMAAGVKNLVLDIPTGIGSKVETVKEAEALGKKFIELGERIGIKVECGITYGGQPVGHTIGPALEAREALQALMGTGPSSLIEKAESLAGLILEIGGVVPPRKGHGAAEAMLAKRRAYKKMQEIIETQGGDPKIRPEDIPIGNHKHTVYAPSDGFVTFVDNRVITAIARAAGAPRDKGAGLIIHVKRGYKVRREEPILEIFAERSTRLQDALRILQSETPIVIEGMLLKVVKEKRMKILQRGSS